MATFSVLTACEELLPDMEDGPDAAAVEEDASADGSAPDGEVPDGAREGSTDADSALDGACPTGSEATGSGECRDIDECERGTHDCSTDPPACVNLDYENGRYECRCPGEGWTGTGRGQDGCTDVNECALGTHTCDDDPLTDCVNVPGGFECGSCPSGYSGDASQGAQGCVPELRGIELPLGRLEPDFDPQQSDYDVVLPGWLTRWQLALDARSSHSLQLNGEDVAANDPLVQPARDGAEVAIQVSAGGASRSYQLHLRMAQPASYLKPQRPEPTSGDNFAAVLALSHDGSTLAVASPYDASCQEGPLAGSGINGNGCPRSGAVYVYARNGSQWTQQAYVKPSNPGSNDVFGTSLALSRDGNALVVGSQFEASCDTGASLTAPTPTTSDDDCGGSGAAYVFTRSNGDWSQAAYLKASTTDDTGDSFGRSVSISGDGSTVAVGAPGEASCATGIDLDAAAQSDNACPAAGAVYLFRNLDGDWEGPLYVKASNAAAAASFGAAVGLNGNGERLAVGAQGTQTAYVFELSPAGWGSGGWDEVARLAPEGTGRVFPSQLALDGAGEILVGGDSTRPLCLDGQTGDQCAANVGAVLAFRRVAGTWEPEPTVVRPASAEAGDGFGFSISLTPDGELFAASAFGDDGCGSYGQLEPLDQTESGCAESGASYVFSGWRDTWTQLAYVKATNPESGDLSFSVGLSSSGGDATLAMGAHFEDACALPEENDCPTQGAAYVYQ